ncbi:lantibiotic biosynthesis protein [Tenacibaculum sp. 190524A02b]|uniref:Lantibiotic biosynthesis protein n=1 Tax=Tenacibaculum vairaonense TaxID=3137860 RepID=A0ABM9PPW0_9FLAO
MIKNEDYFLYDFYALRLPSQPIEAILQLNKNIQDIDFEDFDAMITITDTLFSNEFFREAIFVASKELYNTYINFREKNKKDLDKAKRFLISFYKYYSRMSHRCTPYGLFSGITSGDIANDATKIVFEQQKHNPVFQFNVQTITSLIKKIESTESNLIHTIKYYVNDTLYKLGDKLYFVEKFEKGYLLASNLTSITTNEYIDIILENAKQGATIEELSNLISIPNVSKEQVINFINSLITSQVLISELWVSVSTDDFVHDLLEKVTEKKLNIEAINEVKNTYEKFNNTRKIEDIKEVRSYLKTLPNTATSNEKDSFKADLFYNTKQNTLNKKVVDKIAKDSYELMETTQGYTSEVLNIFKDQFHEKYEQREVPLTLALDPNHGVGYGYVSQNGGASYTPLVSGIPVDGPVNTTIPLNIKMDTIRKNAFKKMCQTNQKVVKIDEDIQKWRNETNLNFKNRVITSSYIFGSLLANSEEDLDQGNFKFKSVQLHSPYTARLLSRFLHGDKHLKDGIKSLTKHEQEINPEAILAEVIYIPDGKFANISLYPNLRDYEITYLSNSKLPSENQIGINDLMVSIKRNRVILRSVKLDKEIIPIMSNTYDPSYGDPIFQFLSAVSYQNISHGFQWDWGLMYSNEPFLPRIEYKNLIITRARWYITKANINYKDDTAVEKYINKIRKELKLPKLLVLAEGDNELLIDLDNKICRHLLARELKDKNLILHEFLNTPDNCFVKDEKGNYSNEILFPIGSKKPMYSKYYSEKDFTIKNKTQRVFYPGSEWLYLKIYSGNKIVENILTEIIGDFAEALVEEKVIDKWFFIRYYDPNPHIRVRFHKPKEYLNHSAWNKILENLQAKIKELVKEDHTVKVMVDSYQREIERYGEETIESSESIFHADSVAIYKFLSMIYGDEGEELRWKFGLISVDRLLNDFGYSIEEKYRLTKNISNYFYNEFNQHNRDGGKIMSRVIKNKFREKRKEIESILTKQHENTDYTEAYECFDIRSASIKKEVAFINNSKMSAIFKDDFMASHIHMTMNRLFLVNQRKHELVVYYFLNKFYESTIARSKQKKVTHAI